MIIFILFLFVNVSCAGTPVPPVKTVPSLRIDTAAVKDAEFRLFDGITLRNLEPDAVLQFPHGITEGHYGVIFITKNGYYPDSLTFESTGNLQTVETVPLKKLEYPDMGVLYGSVCKPVTGGKIKELKGIAELYKNEEVKITQDILTFTTKTDQNGIYRIELFPGEYSIKKDDAQPYTFRIEAGKTTIVNIRKGLVLVD